jgi:predicted transcriptional regulator
MSERRGVHLHRNQASNELEKLRERGIVQRRDAVINGKRGWLYSFVKQ